MSKEVIFEALAFLDGYKPSPSMQGMKNVYQIRDVYIKNAVISLISIKCHNPQTDIGIVVNCELDKYWRGILESNGIFIWVCPFNDFHMPPSIVYSLSYYKLCAFQYVLNNTDYEKFCFIDCDTFAVRDFGSIWIECETSFMIVPNDEGMDHAVRKEIADLYKELYQKTRNITHYASGFIVSSKNSAIEVIKECFEVYKKITDIDAKPKGGDEIIWSLALARLNTNIYSPKVYCLLSNIGFKGYWVDKEDYRDSHIVMWHLPTEKRYALIWAYNYWKKRGKLPPVEKMAKASRIRKIKNKFNLLSLSAILQDSTAVKRNIMKLVKGKNNGSE